MRARDESDEGSLPLPLLQASAIRAVRTLPAIIALPFDEVRKVAHCRFGLDAMCGPISVRKESDDLPRGQEP